MNSYKDKIALWNKYVKYVYLASPIISIIVLIITLFCERLFFLELLFSKITAILVFVHLINIIENYTAFNGEKGGFYLRNVISLSSVFFCTVLIWKCGTVTTNCNNGFAYSFYILCAFLISYISRYLYIYKISNADIILSIFCILTTLYFYRLTEHQQTLFYIQFYVVHCIYACFAALYMIMWVPSNSIINYKQIIYVGFYMVVLGLIIYSLLFNENYKIFSKSLATTKTH